MITIRTKNLLLLIVLGLMIALTPMAAIVNAGWGDDGIFAEPPQPETFATLYVDAGTTTNFTALNVQDNDTIIINATGKLICDYYWSYWISGNGTFTIAGITVNGILEIEPSVVLKIKTGTDIRVNEGGQLLSLGTAASRVAITGESTVAAGHHITPTAGGLVYAQFTDISNFQRGIYSIRGNTKLFNSTISDVGLQCIYHHLGGILFTQNCTISAPSGNYVVSGGSTTTWRSG